MYSEKVQTHSVSTVIQSQTTAWMLLTHCSNILIQYETRISYSVFTLISRVANYCGICVLLQINIFFNLHEIEILFPFFLTLIINLYRKCQYLLSALHAGYVLWLSQDTRHSNLQRLNILNILYILYITWPKDAPDHHSQVWIFPKCIEYLTL